MLLIFFFAKNLSHNIFFLVTIMHDFVLVCKKKLKIPPKYFEVCDCHAVNCEHFQYVRIIFQGIVVAKKCGDK